MNTVIKKYVRRISSVICALVLVLSVMSGAFVSEAGASVSISGKTKNISYSKTPFGQHGKLKVKNGKMVDKNGKSFQIKGVSTHGINWDVGYPYVNKKAFQNLRDEWGVNCVRIAMYTSDYNGYCVTSSTERKNLMKRIDTAVKACKQLGMYVIIDWHVLNDQNPNTYKTQAKSFFKTVSKKYKKYGNVLYEICNEPNGGTTWSDIKSYAKPVIKTIRKNCKNIIIVGTPTWSQDVDIASESPIKGTNLMYTVHFYAATHMQSYRDKVQKAIDNGLPVFCTEFSACDASGNGNYNFTEASKWLKLFDKNGISYVTWSLSNKSESASLLKSSCTRTSGFKTSDLSPMGKWIISKYKK